MVNFEPVFNKVVVTDANKDPVQFDALEEGDVILFDNDGEADDRRVKFVNQAQGYRVVGADTPYTYRVEARMGVHLPVHMFRPSSNFSLPVDRQTLLDFGIKLR